ncbi:MAG: signal peptidase II [Gammaproteobacteria bacterium]|jgi:signal peptidase II
MHRNSLGYAGYLIVSLVIVVSDQITKQIAYQNLGGGPPIEILPVFKFALVLNQGAAFGILNDAGGWQRLFFIALALVFSLVLLVWIWREIGRSRILSFGLALVLGGAIGNLIDRINAGYVIDFIVLHYQDWYFPAFNIADMAITFGAIILIVDSLFFSNNRSTSS